MGDIRLETTPDEFRSHFKRITHFPTAPESTRPDGTFLDLADLIARGRSVVTTDRSGREGWILPQSKATR